MIEINETIYEEIIYDGLSFADVHFRSECA